MSKFKRLSFMENQERFPLMNEEAQKAIKGGCSTCDELSERYPGLQVYTKDEYFNFEGHWSGGIVCGLGYAHEEAVVYGEDLCKIHSLVIEEHFGGNCETCYFDGFAYCHSHEEYFTSACYYCEEDGYDYGSGSSSEEEEEENLPTDPTDPSTDNNDNSGGSDNTSGYGDVDLDDGINLLNPDHFTFNTSDNQAFHDQLTTILKSNSVLGNLLSYFDKGIVHMTFSVGDIGAIAEADTRNDESFHIRFGEEYINGDGWNKTVERLDNMNYDWEKAGVKSGEESLLVVLVHEAMHANHYARFQEADRESSSTAPDYEASVKHMKDNGYSQEFIDIYYCKDDYGYWNHTDVNTHEKKMHDYMDKHNDGVINAALDEYRKEHGN